MRKRKPRDIAESIMTDRLEVIERRLTKVASITTDEAEFVFHAFRALTDSEHSDAEVEMLKSLDAKQSNMLDEAIIEIEALNAPKEKPVES